MSSNAVKWNTLSCGHTPPESESAVECVLSALGHQLHVNLVFHKTRSQSPARLSFLDSSTGILHTSRRNRGGSHRVFSDMMCLKHP